MDAVVLHPARSTTAREQQNQEVILLQMLKRQRLNVLSNPLKDGRFALSHANAQGGQAIFHRL
ncbi:MAG TPA: hypothetical protein VLM78_05505, partial [Anaerolineales bacterium]|nr:hypothetical protein [Anaerolineales bacterium]